MARSFSDTQIVRYKKLTAELYLKCYPQTEIARRLGISQTVVSGYIVEMKEEWKNDARRDFAQIIERELAKLDLLELEYWESWEKSKKEQQIIEERERRNSESGNEVVEHKTTKKRSPGAKSYLDGVQWCIERRAKYLGLDAPVRSANLNINAKMSWKSFIEADIVDDDEI